MEPALRGADKDIIEKYHANTCTFPVAYTRENIHLLY